MQTNVNKYLENTASDSEKTELLNWLRKKENRNAFNQYKSNWEKSIKKDQPVVVDEKRWNQIASNLWERNYSKWQKSQKIKQLFKIAAIFFFVLSVSSFLWAYSVHVKQAKEITTTIIADAGQISKAKLPDGTTVWLNSGSQISYSNLFALKNRNIALSGEVYFDVVKNPDLPMTVQCGQLQVKVLGTKFNVSNYSWHASIDVILEKGTVELFDSCMEKSFYRLVPGERATYNKQSSELSINKINTSKFTAWKEGLINIYDQPLKEVVKYLKMRYNQDFVIDPSLKDLRYTFTIQNEPLEEIIRLMEKITPIKVTQKERIMTIKPNKAKMEKVGK
jgi:transmembrane sensor